MNEKDARIKKVLTELGLSAEPTLTPEQERALQIALDPEQQELDDILRVFQDPSECRHK